MSVFVVESHELFRIALRLILQKANIVVVGESDGFELQLQENKEVILASITESIIATSATVLVTGLHLGRISCTELCQNLKAKAPHIGILVLADILEPSDSVGLVRIGVDGFLRTSADDTEIVKAVRSISRGGTAFDV